MCNQLANAKRRWSAVWFSTVLAALLGGSA